MRTVKYQHHTVRCMYWLLIVKKVLPAIYVVPVLLCLNKRCCLVVILV